MSALMRRRVVPENLVVQNIVEYLMDESAQLPELTAFSFLNRLHELGLGSADFVSLLEGCGAPESAVQKIKANPAMNLQNLILTLEDSGLTSEDYSEMLYTARLVWEQTQTSGGTIVPNTNDSDEEYESSPEETAALLFDEDNSGENYDNTEKPQDFSDKPQEVHETQTISKVSLKTPVKIAETPAEEGLEDEEPTFEEIMKHISSSKKRGAPAETVSESEETASADNNADNSENSETFTDDSDDDFSVEILAEEGQIDEQIAEDILTDEVSDIPNSIKTKEDIEKKSEEISKALEKILNENSDEFSDTFDDNGGDNSEEKPEEDTDESSEKSDDNDENTEPNDEEKRGEITDEDDNDDEEETERRLSASGYNKIALILSGAGAAVLLVLCAVFTLFPKAAKADKPLSYAESFEKIFAEVYESYSAGNMGGDNAQKYFAGEKMFGNILVSQDGFGMLSDGEVVYTAAEDKLTHYNLDGNTESPVEILPPENTRFVEFIQSDSSITAVFSGAECGFMRIEKGAVTFTVRQDGELCDFSVDGGEISFGSVYVPHYTKSFTAVDINEYIPRVGKDEKAVIMSDSIVLGGESGCSFAVWGKYSLADGTVISAKAALGNPVYAGAYGVCAMNVKDGDSEYGRIIGLYDEPKVIKTDKITAAADSKNASAFLQGDVVNIYDSVLSAASVLSNLPQAPKTLKFDGSILLLCGNDGVFSTINCDIPKAPVPTDIQKANGVISGGNAALFSVDKLLEVTFMQLENGTTKQLGVYTKRLSETELPTLELSGAKLTAFCGGSCAIAYKYFDGVSVVSECAVFGGTNSVETLFDDKTGYTAVFGHNGKIIAVNSTGAQVVFE